jgi:hypothetical protein
MSHPQVGEKAGQDSSRICARCGGASQYLARYVLKEGRPIVAG